jgi:leucyl-tRNA synthetase
MSEYNHIDIEKKWRKEWRDQKTYKTFDDYAKEKYYVLDMFLTLLALGYTWVIRWDT